MIRTINGKDYNFKITRKGLREAEKQGMRFNEMMDKPLSMLYYLWYAALYASHPMSLAKTDELLDAYLDNPDTTETMSDVLETLTDEFGQVFGQAVE